MQLYEARFYTKNADLSVTCNLCPHNCVIQKNSRGKCLCRKNIGGTLYSDSYGKVTSMSLAPIEQLPIYFFRSGCDILSIGTYGCNFKCPYCSTHYVSQKEAKYKYISPEKLVTIARENVSEGNIGVAYTYNEPVTSYEYIYDCAKLASSIGLSNVLVTNGFISEEPLTELLPFIDAVNIDLKSMSDDYYTSFLDGDLDNVKSTIVIANECSHVEISTLVMPRVNDSESEIKDIAQFISSISSDIPLHLSSHTPSYKMFEANTVSTSRLKKLSSVAKVYLNNVYCENPNEIS